MNKQDLIDFVAATNDLTKKQSSEIVEGILNRIGSELADGSEVTLHGFGKFSVNERAARDGRNPATGAPLRIEASKSVKFKAAKPLNDKL